MIQYSYTFDPETRTLTPSGDPVNVKGDTNVVQIVFTMPASYEGLALSSYVWRVFYKIAMNTKLEEVRFHQFTDQTTEGENLVLTWTVTNSVTEFAVHLGFALSGTLTDTGGNVTNRINSIPAYERIEPTIGGGSYTEDDAEIEGIKDFLVGIQEAAEAAQAAAETAAAEAEASAARAEQIADELEPYKSLAIVESASGDPATFTDGSNGVPMKSVSVGIEPKQDLNGFEYPWVGGAGKNILQVTATTQTVNGVTFTVNSDGTIKANGTASGGNAVLQLNSAFEITDSDEYYFSGCPEGGSPTTYMLDCYGRNTGGGSVGDRPNYYGQSSLKLSDLSGAVKFNTFIAVVFNGATVNNIVFNPMVRKATYTDSTFAPYSNLCPISGWDEVKVTRTGKNLFDPSKATDGKYINSDGGESTSATFSCSDYIPVHGIRMVYFSGFNGGWGSAPRYALYDKDKRKISTTHPNTSITSFPVTIGDAYYLRTSLPVVNKGTVMIEVSDTATDYEAYQGQTFPISLTSAGTVYGGTLNVATGELVVDRKMVDVGSIEWSVSGSGTSLFFYKSFTTAKPTANDSTVPEKLICENYRTVARNGLLNIDASCTINERRIVCIRDSRYTTVASFREGTSGVKLVYELESPLTYTLTPSQITSLLGTNHVWADCGEVAVEYVADTKMYIDKIVASL